MATFDFSSSAGGDKQHGFRVGDCRAQPYGNLIPFGIFDFSASRFGVFQKGGTNFLLFSKKVTNFLPFFKNEAEFLTLFFREPP